MSCNAKPLKTLPKSTSPGTKGITTRSPLLSKAGKDRIFSNSLSNTVEKPESSAASKCSTIELSETDTLSSAPTSRSKSRHDSLAKNGATKKEREKERNPSVQRYRVAESTAKGIKDPRSDAKQKVGTRRNSSSEILRKNMKGIGIGPLPVGVAS